MLFKPSQFERDPSFSDRLPWGVLTSDEGDSLLTKRGALMSSYRFTGSNVYGIDDDMIAHEVEGLNEALVQQGQAPGAFAFLHAYKTPVEEYPQNGQFPDIVTALIDFEQGERYKAAGVDGHMETHQVLTFGYREPDDLVSRAESVLLPTGANGVDPASSRVAKNFGVFLDLRRAFETTMSTNYRLNRMGERRVIDARGKQYEVNDFISFLHYCATFQDVRLRAPRPGVFLDTVLGGVPFVDQYDHLRVGEKYVVNVTWQQFPHKGTQIAMLHELTNLRVPLMFSNRLLMMGKDEALRRVAEVDKHWEQRLGSMWQILRGQNGAPGQKFNPFAASMLQENRELREVVEGGSVNVIDYTPSVLIPADSLEQANAWAQDVQRVIIDAGFTPLIEKGPNIRPSFFGSLPGDVHSNRHLTMATSENVAHVLPTTSTWSGPRYHQSPYFEKNSPPLFFATTTGGAIFRGHLHADEVGHGLIAGPSGAGKSALLSFLAAQHLRYRDAQVFVLDKDYSMFPLAAALAAEGQGAHYTVGQGLQVGFCPFARIHESAAEMDWAVGWVRTIVESRKVEVDLDLQADIENALKLLASLSDRSLSMFRSRLRSERLKKAVSAFANGALGELFNHSEEVFSDVPLTVFELREVLQMSRENSVPAFMYLAHLIERRVFRRPTMIIIDEGWRMLEDEYLCKLIREWLNTLRKRNAQVIFATTQLGDVANSKIGTTIIQECVTKVFLPNPAARSKDIRPFYTACELADHEIELLASKTFKRKKHYYYTSPLGRAPFTLVLGKIARAFCGASDGDSLKALWALIEAYPKTYVARWLGERVGPQWSAWYYKQRGIAPEPDVAVAQTFAEPDESDAELEPDDNQQAEDEAIAA